jgi:mannose-1-phosphate guanylyltransferase
MRALLLAAGLGTRLRPLTDTIPKCLVPVDGTPLLDIWLELLLKGGTERVLINAHYLSDKVKQHVVASRWKAQIDLVYEKDLLGTGGTILANESFFQGKAFMVAHADNLTWFDAEAFIARHTQRPASVQITMMTFRTEMPQSCGIVELDGAGVVVGFHEKVANPPGNLANGAVYIFEPDVIAFIKSLKKPVVDVSTEVLPHFLGRIVTYENDVYLRDIGTPESLAKANSEYPRVLRGVRGA